MVTTFSNPKEMLGYKIIQDLSNAPDILKAAPYDRKAAYSYYYVLRNLHAQMVSFHRDMFVLDLDDQGNPIKYSHDQAYPAIIAEIRDNWATVYSNQQDKLLEALFKFSELIASSFPKLGLVPESGETIHEEERVINPIEDEEQMEEEVIDNEPIPSDTINENKPVEHNSRPTQTSSNVANTPPTQVPGSIVRKPTGYRFT